MSYMTFYNSPRAPQYERVLNVRVPDETYQRLADLSHREGLNQSDTIRLVLERGLIASGVEKAQKEDAKWQKPSGARKKGK